MRLILVALLLVACAIVAAAQDCGDSCNVVVKSPPSAELQVCVARNGELYDITVQLAARVKGLEMELAALKNEKPAKAKASSKPKTKTVKRKSRGCKPGRTRNAAGKCGRW